MVIQAGFIFIAPLFKAQTTGANRKKPGQLFYRLFRRTAARKGAEVFGAVALYLARHVKAGKWFGRRHMQIRIAFVIF